MAELDVRPQPYAKHRLAVRQLKLAVVVAKEPLLRPDAPCLRAGQSARPLQLVLPSGRLELRP